MPPKEKKTAKTMFKTGSLAKDIIPPHIKNPPREGRPQRRPGDVNVESKTKYYQEYKHLEEWPGDEVKYLI